MCSWATRSWYENTAFPQQPHQGRASWGCRNWGEEVADRPRLLGVPPGPWFFWESSCTDLAVLSSLPTDATPPARVRTHTAH